MSDEKLKSFDSKQRDVLHSIRISRVIFPIILGIVVVMYLLWKQFDLEEFSKIDWSAHTLFWISVAALVLIVRHLAYAWRLRILSDGHFSWLKCIQLIFIWEFSSAVSPTSLGGSAVALLVLSQEKLSTAKTTAIVIYTIVLDTIFFIFTLPILFFWLGPIIIRPGLIAIESIDGWAYTFIAAYIFMAIYGAAFFYGLLIDPRKIKRTLVILTYIPFLKRFRGDAIKLGDDLMITSRELKNQKWSYHLSAFLATVTAWSFRFLVLNCLIIAIVPETAMGFIEQSTLFARLESMFVIMAFSPTPGGSGFAEFVFGGFLSDYVPQGIALVIALIWRIMAYYSYLLAE